MGVTATGAGILGNTVVYGRNSESDTLSAHRPIPLNNVLDDYYPLEKYGYGLEKARICSKEE